MITQIYNHQFIKDSFTHSSIQRVHCAQESACLSFFARYNNRFHVKDANTYIYLYLQLSPSADYVVLLTQTHVGCIH